MTKKFFLRSTLALVLAGTLSFCKKEKSTMADLSDSPMVPGLLPEQVDDYPASSNDYLAALGRVLFYDKELSANKNISCGSCHQQQHSFADGLSFSLGTNSLHTKRNTPQIFSRTGRFFWDGRASSMQDMVLMPVQNNREMNTTDLNLLVDRLNSIDYYSPLISHAFPGTKEIDSVKIKTAVTEFMKNINFSKNKFAASINGSQKLTPQEQNGKDLFFGTAGCSNCHRLAPVSANEYYSSFAQSHNIGLDIDNPDPGVAAVTKNSKDAGSFFTPVLINVEFTAPYMHDGRFQTLEEVVEHYNSKVENNPNLDFLLKDFSTQKPKRLNLNDDQKSSLVAFLKTLSDPAVMTDKRFSDPFIPRQ